MNLDELISKYLDGELSEAEDQILRSQLSEDAIARFKFDSAVNLHLAFKDDAEMIYPPEELIEKTEDMILMRIFAQAPETQKRKMLVWNSVPMMAAVIVFFLFSFVFEIAVPPMYNFNNISINENKKDNGLNRNLNQTVVSKKNKEIKINSRLNTTSDDVSKTNVIVDVTNNSVNTDNFDRSIVNNELSNTEQIDEVTNKSENQSNHLDNSENSITKNLAIPSVPFINPIDENGMIENSDKFPISQDVNIAFNKSAMNTLVSGQIANQNMSSFNNKVNGNTYIPNVYDFSNHTDIQLGSFFGTDFLRSGIDADDAVISHFSQSIAYAYDDNERFGMELGYTEYSYNEKAVINVKTGLNGIKQETGIESFEGGYDFSISSQQSITINNTKQMIWASAFYEYSFLTTEDFALAGRLGAGASNEGPLGYGRLFMVYEVFDLLQFTIGIESRMFSAETTKYIKDDNKLKTTGSIIYGLQFKF